MPILGGSKKHRHVRQNTKGQNRIHSQYTHANDIASQLMEKDDDQSSGPGLFARLFNYIWGKKQA